MTQPEASLSRCAPARRWYVLAAGFAANAAFSAAISGLPAAGVLMRDGYALSTSGVGVAVAGVGLGIAASELPWGMLTDRIGDRRVLLSGLALTAAVLAWMAAFASPLQGHRPSLTHLASCMALLGLAGGSLNGSSGRAVMTWFTDRERGLAMSIRQTALPAGGAVGAIAVPAMAAHGGFHTAYGMLSTACVAAAVCCWRWLGSPPGARRAEPIQRAAPASPSPLRRWQIWRIVLAMSALCVPQIAVLGFLAIFLHDVAHFTVAATSAATGAYQTGAVALRVWSGAWTDRRANRPAFLRQCSLASATTFGALAVLAAGSSDPGHAPAWNLLIMLVLGGMIASCWHGVAFTELAVRAGSAHVGTALGMGNTLVFTSYFLTPLIVPVALRDGGWPAAWWLVAACALAALPIFPRQPRGAASR